MKRVLDALWRIIVCCLISVISIGLLRILMDCITPSLFATSIGAKIGILTVGLEFIGGFLYFALLLLSQAIIAISKGNKVAVVLSICPMCGNIIGYPIELIRMTNFINEMVGIDWLQWIIVIGAILAWCIPIGVGIAIIVGEAWGSDSAIRRQKAVKKPIEEPSEEDAEINSKFTISRQKKANKLSPEDDVVREKIMNGLDKCLENSSVGSEINRVAERYRKETGIMFEVDAYYVWKKLFSEYNDARAKLVRTFGEDLVDLIDADVELVRERMGGWTEREQEMIERYMKAKHWFSNGDETQEAVSTEDAAETSKLSMLLNAIDESDENDDKDDLDD